MKVQTLKAAAILGILAFAPSASHAEDTLEFPGETWTKVAAPEDMGWSSSRLAEAQAFSERIGSTAVMIVQHGAVISQWGEVTTKSPAHSVRKSLLSALIGIAVAEKKIDLNNTLDDLGIDDNEPPLTEAEKQATVGDLIKSRSGIYHPALYESKNMTASKPNRGSHATGSFWHYNNWDFNALGTIYMQSTGHDIFEAFENQIATPLQMEDYVPGDGEYFTGSKSVHAAYPFRISARDLARFGLLYLRNGRWQNRQIVPDDWVATSTSSHSEIGPERGYGYMWWTGRGSFRRLKVREHSFYASGYRRQQVFVFPYLDLVVVHRINSDTSKAFPAWRQMERLLWHIFEAAGETDIGPVPALERAEGTQLTEEDLKRILPGATLTGVSRKGSPYRMTLHADGKLNIVAGYSDENSDTGKWRIEGDKYCRQFSKWVGGRDFCYSVVKEKNTMKIYDDMDTFIASAELTNR